MRRTAVSLFLLAILGLLITVPGWSDGSGSGSSTYEPTTITDYRADFTIATNGDLTAVETISVEFPTARHGIFRYFDTHDASAPNARRIPEDITVTQDGSPATTSLSWRNHHRERVVQVGDANRTITGIHTYVIRYRIAGVLEKGTDGSPTQFYWNLIPGGWGQVIEQATLTAHLPTPATSLRCAVGTDVEAGCAAGAGSDTLTVKAGSLNPHTPVTIKAGLDMATPPVGHWLPWSGSWDAVLGRSIVTPIIAGILALLTAAWALILVRRTHEDDPGFPLQYAPPEGIGPAQAEYVRSEKVTQTAYVASMLYAAEKGAIQLSKDGSDWTITETGQGWDGLDEVTREISRLIEAPNTSFTASKNDITSGQTLLTYSTLFKHKVATWALDAGDLAPIRGIQAGAAVVIACGALLIAWPFFLLPFVPTIWAAIPAAFATLGMWLGKSGADTRRTGVGRRLWSQVGGFHRILSTTSAEERFDFASKHELYTAYLPWAVAFGCADTWAEKFRLETGVEPPTPSYFQGYVAGSLINSSVASMVSSFESSVSGSISAYEATQHSSSSSGGGGGFSGGGGGGGGGGGSW